MRILVVGAGAIGGYFGGRLLDAGRDVTFLVRERRAAQLAQTGLNVLSPNGDLSIAKPPVVLAKDVREPFDLILLSCKAYDLDGAIESIKTSVGPDTAILAMLNGMHHLDLLEAQFGADRVLGGQCIAAVQQAGGLQGGNLDLIVKVVQQEEEVGLIHCQIISSVILTPP